MVQLSGTTCSCVAILWVSLVSFTAITLCVSSQRVFIVVYFVTDSVRKLLDTFSYSETHKLSYAIKVFCARELLTDTAVRFQM
jgi:uncharacterized membrane protein